jgi:hypothetical protein
MTHFEWRWLAALLASALAGCETADATYAVVENGYEADAGPTTATVVYKTWWSVALFPEPVAAGETSAPVRVVPGADFAYALLAPGWNPGGADMPALFVPVRTTAKLSVERGGTLRVAISDATAIGNCAAGEPLSADDAAFIVDRIFPGEFTGMTYDPATCTSTPVTEDAGSSGDASDAADAAAE